MADLEDTILKRNIPGRWSSYDDKNERNRENCDHDDDGENCDHQKKDIAYNSQTDAPKTEEEQLLDLARNLAYDDVPESVRQSIIAQRMRGNSTGVKGVLADYKADQALISAQREAKKNYRDAVLHRIAVGATNTTQEINNLESHIEDDDEDDDEFLQEFRLKRLQEMQMSSRLPTFGYCLDIKSHSQFLQEINQADPRIHVIVHLYEPSIRSCVMMNRYLDEICLKYTHCKFLRMPASSSGINIDRVGFPMLSIYRAGENIHVLAGLEEELGERFTREDIEWLLESNEVLNEGPAK